MINQKKLLNGTAKAFLCLSVVVCGKIACANDMLVDSLQKNTVPFESGVSGFYNKIHNSQQKGFDVNMRGIGVHIQSQLNDLFLMRLGYVYTDATTKKNHQKTDIQTDSYYIYGKYQPQKWYIAGQMNYHHGRYKDKNNLIKTEKGKTDIYQTAVISGYHFGNVHNYSGLKYTYVYTDKNGNSITPTVNGEVLTATIGTKYAPNYSINKCTTVTPMFHLAGSYDIKSNNALTVIDLPESNVVVVLDGKRLHRASLKAGAGVGIQFKKLELSANYDVDWRVSHFSQTGKLSFKYRF